MRSSYLYVAIALLLVVTGTAVGGEKAKTKVVTQQACATGTCPTATVPTTYVVRERVLVPTTVETVYKIESQTVIQEEPVRAEVCRPVARLRLPRLRLFGGSCCQ